MPAAGVLITAVLLPRVSLRGLFFTPLPVALPKRDLNPLLPLVKPFFPSLSSYKKVPITYREKCQLFSVLDSEHCPVSHPISLLSSP